MNKYTKRILAILCAAVLLLLCGCDSTPAATDPTVTDPTDPPVAEEKNWLYGVNYVDSAMSDRVSVNQATNLAAALGAKSIRLNPGVVESGTTLFPTASTRLETMLSGLTLSGVEQVIVEIPNIPMDGVMGNMAPYPDLEDEEYLAFLKEVEDMVTMLVESFPNVQYWQIGNLTNVDRFLYPLGWKEENSPVDPFTLEEKAHITVDIMYVTSKVVKASGADKQVIMPAMAAPNGEDMVAFLEQIYTLIESGNHGSKNPGDFFDALAWHPVNTAKPDEAWVEANNAIYAVAQKHNDGERKVYLTELGFDSADEAAVEEHAQWIEAAYTLVAEKMPYVASMHYYRLFNDGAERNGLFNEPREGFASTEKAKVFQSLAGGSGDLDRYVIREDQYSSGDNVALSVPTKASSSCEHPGWGWSLSGVNNGTTEYGGWSNYYEMGEADWIHTPTGGGSNDYNKPEWVEFMLPYAWEINKVIIYPRNEVDENFHQIMALPRWTVVEVSMDGETWTQVGELKIAEADIKVYDEGVTYVERSENPPLEISFDAVTTRYVRVTFKQLCTNWQHYEDYYFVQVYEIEIIMA